MITKINEFRNNFLAQNGSLNPTKKNVFTKTNFIPSFEISLYNELKKILPHGYKFDITMWGNKNQLTITDLEANTIKIMLPENATVYRVSNIVKNKLSL